MRVIKAKKEPAHKDIAILIDEDTIYWEDVGLYPYDKVMSGVKIFAHIDVIKEIWKQKKIGEVLKYDGEIRKWRKSCPPGHKRTTWNNHPSEVTVSHSRSFPTEISNAIKGYCEWRDWVESYGGNITGSTSSTSYSLFKTTISGDTWETPFDGIQRIRQPIGGRLLRCKARKTSFQGDIIQWDLYSAYSRRLGSLQFGGMGSKWREVNKPINFDRMVEKGICVYVEATVWPNKLYPGPLPTREDKSHRWYLFATNYPNDEQIEGIWTYEEIREAERTGARVKFHKAYYHIATGKKYHHEDWYRIIQEGRNNLNGFARSLAKATGNSLWGRYAMQPRRARTVWRVNGKNVWNKHPTKSFSSNQCMELADQLCGKIRSDLYRLAISASDSLIQGNTDGAWIEYERGWLPPSNDWRIKNRTNRIDVLDDATYRYWIEGKEDPEYVVPGIITEHTEESFERRWNEVERSTA